MSDVYRYEFDENGVCYRKPDGPFVSHDDYAAIHYERIHDLNQIGGLQEENARLKAEVERLDILCKQLMTQHSDISCENIMLRKAGDALGDSIEIYRLKAEVDLWKLRSDNWQKLVQLTKAEVERLRKAGDAIIMITSQYVTDSTLRNLALRDWNAAKEGKPSI